MPSRLVFIRWSIYFSLCLSITLASVVTSNIHLIKEFEHFSNGIESPEGENELSVLALKLGLIVFLVLLGGLLAGLMSLDETNLEILIKSGTPQQRVWALRILPIRKNGHLLLVTMMLANTLTNMALPILIDGIFGGGIYAKSFRKPSARGMDSELVRSLHGQCDLSYDEVTIIRGALDLGEKTARQVMTTWSFVFMLDISANLDWVTMRDIQRAGHSRIPVFQGTRDNVVGLILTKSLLLLNPNLPTPVSKVKMYPIPRVKAETSLVNLLNIFQVGASHMALVVDQQNSILGIVTLEDVIEELIQEEIVDETDVYIDVVKRNRANRSVQDSRAILAAQRICLPKIERSDDDISAHPRSHSNFIEINHHNFRPGTEEDFEDASYTRHVSLRSTSSDGSGALIVGSY
ncbi:hypothetical protein L0F63_001313 [Massospora cicadina]|nr:hypothetical protein L0F63_001313 [Massospora cicadina]